MAASVLVTLGGCEKSGGPDQAQAADLGTARGEQVAGSLAEVMSLDRDFDGYPANMSSDGFTGPVIDGDWREMRTFIRSNWGTEANFANRFRVMQAGCGTGCSYGIVGDHFTGRVYDLGLGGEEQSYLTLRYRVDSEMLKAGWQTSEACVVRFYRWTGEALAPVSPQQIFPRPADGYCAFDGASDDLDALAASAAAAADAADRAADDAARAADDAMRAAGMATEVQNQGPSFNCERAASRTEQTICASAELSALDREVAESFRYAENSGRVKQLTVTQVDWLRARDRCAADVECIRQSYELRNYQLSE